MDPYVERWFIENPVYVFERQNPPKLSIAFNSTVPDSHFGSPTVPDRPIFLGEVPDSDRGKLFGERAKVPAPLDPESFYY